MLWKMLMGDDLFSDISKTKWLIDQLRTDDFSITNVVENSSQIPI